jgi:uncharacterized protein (DUF4415 family)
MRKSSTIKRSSGKRTGGKTDFDRLAVLTDAKIKAAVASDSDAAPIADKDWFASARVVNRPAKTPISIKLDNDVLQFFRSMGAGYQTRINAVLRAYMQHLRY